MSSYLWVGIGGFIGSVARYAVSMGLHASVPGRFPWGTFAVNCIGCVLIGLLAAALDRTPAPNAARLFLMTGMLGGFTTFSAFGLEAVGLLRRGEWGVAGAYVLGSVLVGLAGVWLGLRLMEPPQSA